jgi:polyisoprenoid-binding protein YceI
MKIRSASGLVLLPLLALAACNSGGGAPHATADAPAATTGAAAGVAYRVAPPDSKVEFTGSKVTGKHDGSFQKFDGTVKVPGNDATKGSVEVAIDVGSLMSDEEKLTGHLKSPDLLDVAKYPTAKFTSTSIKPGGANGATHTITGNLELHGVTKSISFPATVRVSADKVDVDAAFAINRKDFGIVYPGMPDDLIKDDVAIRLTIRAPKAGQG